MRDAVVAVLALALVLDLLVFGWWVLDQVNDEPARGCAAVASRRERSGSASDGAPTRVGAMQDAARGAWYTLYTPEDHEVEGRHGRDVVLEPGGPAPLPSMADQWTSAERVELKAQRATPYVWTRIDPAVPGGDRTVVVTTPPPGRFTLADIDRCVAAVRSMLILSTFEFLCLRCGAWYSGRDHVCADRLDFAPFRCRHGWPGCGAPGCFG